MELIEGTDHDASIEIEKDYQEYIQKQRALVESRDVQQRSQTLKGIHSSSTPILDDVERRVQDDAWSRTQQQRIAQLEALRHTRPLTVQETQELQEREISALEHSVASLSARITSIHQRAEVDPQLRQPRTPMDIDVVRPVLRRVLMVQVGGSTLGTRYAQQIKDTVGATFPVCSITHWCCEEDERDARTREAARALINSTHDAVIIIDEFGFARVSDNGIFAGIRTCEASKDVESVEAARRDQNANALMITARQQHQPYVTRCVLAFLDTPCQHPTLAQQIEGR